jgi:hypothetical protein
LGGWDRSEIVSPARNGDKSGRIATGLAEREGELVWPSLSVIR